MPVFRCFAVLFALLSLTALATPYAVADESQLILPRANVPFNFAGHSLSSDTILILGLVISTLGILFGLSIFLGLKKLPAHRSMLEVSTLIYGTCKTYLMQQAKLLLGLELLIAGTMTYYFGILQHKSAATVALILMWSVIGIAGSFMVAWFGMAINNIANSRMAFASLRGRPYAVSEIPTRSGMSIGVLLISVELSMMIAVLKFVPPELAGSCFIGFAIGESLGASVLRICGGIFTKIADIGSDLMKIVFKIKEDDARNPGVIADCAGDNAGDSVGPTADGFETYGVTGVALITFILLAVAPQFQWEFIVWIFAMRIVMIPAAVFAWKFNSMLSRAIWGKSKGFSFEHPLTNLVWLTSLLCIAVSFVVSFYMLHDDRYGDLRWKLPLIISCGTIAGAVIPEFTKVFTSTHSRHVREVVNASQHGGASLNILSGFVAGNMSAFWLGLVMLLLMGAGYLVSTVGLGSLMVAPAGDWRILRATS